MDINQYLDTVSIDTEAYRFIHNADSLLNNIAKNTEKNPLNLSEKFQIAILGVPEDRNTPNKGTSKAPDEIRKELYKLYKPSSNIRIIDLGNLKRGKNTNDTYIALKDVIYELLKKKIIPVVIGGSQELTRPIFAAYEKLKRVTNITAVDSKFDIGDSHEQFDSQSYLSNIVSKKSKYLFNFSNIGYQTYYVPQDDIELMNKMYFDTLRLGLARSKIQNIEPYIRDSDLVTMDISSVKSSDAPGHYDASIHGFYGEEICQIARYCGTSIKLSCLGLFEVNPDFDKENKTSKLAAQIIWHFLQGFSVRKNEQPKSDSKKFQKFIVTIKSTENQLIFYKSNQSNRWWIEIPYIYRKVEKTLIISCSEDDYFVAARNEIPDIWWKYFQKLN
jgi:arginase family enzyme